MTDRKEYMREYNRMYREKNKDKLSEQKKQYSENHKDDKKAYDRKRYLAIKNNPEYIKKKKINSWKRQGMILREDENWNDIYLNYTTQQKCDDCECVLNCGIKGNARNLDHDHQSGFIRGLVCHACNMKRM